MPQILVVTDPHSDDQTVVYRERVSAADLESKYFSGQLVERVGWAVSDASSIERSQGRRLTVVHPALNQASSSQR